MPVKKTNQQKYYLDLVQEIYMSHTLFSLYKKDIFPLKQMPRSFLVKKNKRLLLLEYMAALLNSFLRPSFCWQQSRRREKKHSNVYNLETLKKTRKQKLTRKKYTRFLDLSSLQILFLDTSFMYDSCTFQHMHSLTLLCLNGLSSQCL